ncbi:hypothetical protein [Streptomyces sp. NPDC097640]|uniref:hypothetical protein n=1 Tax=Streptomyces sp. NPDC097640 TaxID=3157229 RepID=UPI00331B944A
MDKATALRQATDAVTVFAQVVTDYGQGSPEAASAEEGVRRTFLVARAHGATDGDLRATHCR